MQGGNLGYRLLCNLAPPLDRPVGEIGPLAAVHMHNMMKALNLLKEAKKRDDLELASLKDKAVKLEGLEKEVQ
uniref:Uncharacterized protein n=1 Tax=Chenopodium quinoa TaxID=63459 RepID=A0A803MS82_CHEQI